MLIKMCSVFKIVFLTVLCLFSMSQGSGQDCYGAEPVPTIETEHLFDLDADFMYPCDVTVNPDGQIYVVDGISNSVKIFDKNGKYTKRANDLVTIPGRYICSDLNHDKIN